MRDPVVAADGFCYEKEAIEMWFKKRNTSPMTNQTLTVFLLFPNHTLRSRIKGFLEKKMRKANRTSNSHSSS